MPAAYKATGTPASSTNLITPALPAGWAAGDFAVLVVATAEADDAVPTVTGSGTWTYAGSDTGGGGTFGVGTGNRRITYFYRALVTGDTAPTVTMPGSVGVATTGVVLTFTKSASEAWAVVSPRFGYDTSSATTFSATLTGIPSRFTAGAVVVAAAAVAVGAAQAFSAEALTATGATVGTVTERSDTANTAGNAVALATATASVTAGTATAAPVLSATLAAAATGIGGLLVLLATTGSITAQQGYTGDPVRYNRITNPSAEALSSTGWAGYANVAGSTAASVNAQEEGLPIAPSGIGTRVFKCTGPAGNTNALGMSTLLESPITRGNQVHVRFDCYVPVGGPTDQIQVILREDSTNSTFNTIVLTNLNPGAWVTYDTVATLAANELERVYLVTVDSANNRGIDSVYFDNVVVEQYTAGQDKSYFDGDTMLAGYVAVWTGTMELSGSLLYAAYDPPRVGVTLTNWAQDATTQVYRVYADGTKVPVRGGDVTPSGGAAFVWDYEFPTNTEYYYSADDSGTDRTTDAIAEVILRTNRASNPNMQTTSTGVNSNNGALYPVTFDATGGVGGTGSAVATFIGTPAANGATASVYVSGTTTAGVAALTVVPGQRLRISTDVRAEKPQRAFTTYLAFYDSTPASLGLSLGTNSGMLNPPGQHLRVGAEVADVPDGAAYALQIITVSATNGDSQIANERTWFDQVLVEDRVGVAPFFSGDTRGVGYRWTGTANQSTSQQYITDVATPQIIPDTRSLLRAPGLPGLDTVVRFGRVPQRSHPRPVNYLAPIGRATLVPQASARQKAQFTLDLVTLTTADADDLLTFMEGSAIAYLLWPNTRHHGTYVSLSDLTAVPNATIGPQEQRWQVQAVEVSRPAGGIAYDPSASWQAIVSTSASWQAVLNSYPTWLDVLRGPGL